MGLENHAVVSVELGKMGATSPKSTSAAPVNASTPSDGESNGESAATRISQDVAKVARSSLSPASRHSESRALNPEPGSHLDPSSPSFDDRAWVKEFIRLTESDPESAPSRALGVAFKGLSVFGWGTGAEFQKTTGSVVIGIARQLARLVRGSRHGSRVDILRDFEGVVERGEMLIVLGPPGSGCSTLLKSLSGEMAGLKMSHDSYINFRGRCMMYLRP